MCFAVFCMHFNIIFNMQKYDSTVTETPCSILRYQEDALILMITVVIVVAEWMARLTMTTSIQLIGEHLGS